MIEDIIDLFGKFIHGRISKIFRQNGSPVFLSRRIDVKDAKVLHYFGHIWIVEQGLEVGQPGEGKGQEAEAEGSQGGAGVGGVDGGAGWVDGWEGMFLLWDRLWGGVSLGSPGAIGGWWWEQPGEPGCVLPDLQHEEGGQAT